MSRARSCRRECAALPPAAPPSVHRRPRVEVPSERSSTAPGMRLPPAPRRLVNVWTARLMASPIAVCPPACSWVRAERTAERLVVGDWSSSGRSLKMINPTRIALGTSERKRSAARCPAPRRLGVTSVAAIELETSSTSITAPSVTGTATLRCGRAAARIKTAMATRNTIMGACRRQRGPLGTTEGRSGAVTNDWATRVRRRCSRPYQTMSSGTAPSARSTSGDAKLMAPHTPSAAPPTSPAR